MSAEFLLTAFIVVLLPGTDILYTLATGLGFGACVSTVAALGCMLGTLRQLLLALFGFSAILHASGSVFHALNLVGTLYLLCMIWQILQGSGVLSVPPRSHYGTDDGFASATATDNALLVRIKDNQLALRTALAGLSATRCPFDSHETVDCGRHGRQGHRPVEVFDTVSLLDAPWQTLVSCVARVSRLIYIKNTYSGLCAAREKAGYYPCQARHRVRWFRSFE